MPIDPNTYTLADYAANSNDPVIKSAAVIMIDAGSLFRSIPMIEDKTLKQSGARITGDLPVENWVDIGAPPVVNKDPDDEIWEEGIFVYRNAATCDQLLLEDKNNRDDPLDRKVKLKIQGLSYSLNYKFIQNKHTGTGTRVNRKCFVGLRERLDDPGRYGTNPDCLINGNGVDLSSGGTGNSGLDMEFYLDQLLYELGSPDGDGITLAGNGLFRRSFDRTVKKAGSGGGFSWQKDNYGRQVPTFRNAVLIDAGRLAPTGPKTARTQPPIISTTETADGTQDTGGTFTSVYGFKSGADSLYAWTFGMLKPTDPYLLPDGVTWQVNVNGNVGNCHAGHPAQSVVSSISSWHSVSRKE